MVNKYILNRLFTAFPNAIINGNFEFVAEPHIRVNSYFRLEDCETEVDVEAKLLEWLSREAHKSLHFDADWRNKMNWRYHLNGINSFLGTNFNLFDMNKIYTYLGNRCNHEKTLRFIRSGYSMEVLTDADHAEP